MMNEFDEALLLELEAERDLDLDKYGGLKDVMRDIKEKEHRQKVMKKQGLDSSQEKVKDEQAKKLIEDAVICFNSLLDYQREGLVDGFATRQMKKVDETEKQRAKGKEVELTSKNTMKNDWKSVNTILMKGKDNRDLTDELFCHCIKQVQKCPSLKKAERGWHIFAFLCPFFYPHRSTFALFGCFLVGLYEPEDGD